MSNHELLTPHAAVALTAYHPVRARRSKGNPWRKPKLISPTDVETSKLVDWMRL